MLTQKEHEEAGMHTIKGLQYFCMTPYDASFTGVNILFPKENVTNTLASISLLRASVSSTQLKLRSTLT